MTTNQAAGGGGIGLSALVAYLDEFLEAGKGSDFGPNGLQVEGRERVHKLVTGVSSCVQLFARARAAGADAVLVHHGEFWEGLPRTLTGFRYRQVAELIQGGVGLLDFLFPLPPNPEGGTQRSA